MNTLQPMNIRRCTATNRAGNRCARPPIVGGFVCNLHGGKTPAAIRSAQERIQEMVDPALAKLARLMESADTDAVSLAAARDILDRAGYGKHAKLDVAVAQTFTFSIASTSRDEPTVIDADPDPDDDLPRLKALK